MSMAGLAPASTGSPAIRVVARVVVFYAILIGVGIIARDQLPGASPLSGVALGDLMGDPKSGAQAAASTGADSNRTLSVIIAMMAAILLSLPVAWIYQLTRAKRGYQQSVVQLLIILPLVVAGIVVLIKYSLALAFGMAAIVAAVRFRNTLDDSKDAVYVFLATAIGLSAAVDIPVDRKSTRLNSSHGYISYAVFCLKKKTKKQHPTRSRFAAHAPPTNPHEARCTHRHSSDCHHLSP